MNTCNLCPKKCHANRDNGQLGFCGVSNKIRIARAALHYWEEPCISGESGSGAIFFSGCNLHCIFCQNRLISDGKNGKDIDIARLIDIFFELEKKGANNINLVTPTHYTIEIKEAITKAKDMGFNLPFVYNSSGYESVDALRSLEGLIDIYLPDFKYMSKELSLNFSNAADYPSIAKAAIDEMYRQVGTPTFFDDGIIKKGVIVRHLVLPNHTNDSKAVIDYLYKTYGDNIYLSLMSQYTPVNGNDKAMRYPELMRPLTKREYARVIDYCLDLGVNNAFIQEGDVAKESFIPEFDCEGV